MRKSSLAPIERLVAARMIDDNGCWLSSYKLAKTGYAVIGDGRSVLYAHRLSYEHFVGPIPTGKQIDHLCRNRACWNPAHLEPVTQRTNIARGDSPGARAVRTNECRKGHSLVDAYVQKDGTRTCRVCALDRAKRHYARKKG